MIILILILIAYCFQVQVRRLSESLLYYYTFTRNAVQGQTCFEKTSPMHWKPTTKARAAKLEETSEEDLPAAISKKKLPVKSKATHKKKVEMSDSVDEEQARGDDDVDADDKVEWVIFHDQLSWLQKLRLQLRNRQLER